MKCPGGLNPNEPISRKPYQPNSLQQRVAGFRDAAVEFVAAAGVGMRGLGQTAEGGVDVRGL